MALFKYRESQPIPVDMLSNIAAQALEPDEEYEYLFSGIATMIGQWQIPGFGSTGISDDYEELLAGQWKANKPPNSEAVFKRFHHI